VISQYEIPVRISLVYMSYDKTPTY
jgi:hypothetical protein